MIRHVWFVLTCSLALVLGGPVEKRSSKCYGDLGCFSTDPPFFSAQRPINFLPAKPSSINTRFLLFTRQNKDKIYLKADDVSTIKSSTFDPARPTKMIVHGFLENGFVQWMNHMKDQFLKHGDYNVINIDWGGGSLPPYTQATANTRVVGAEVAKLIKVLQQETGAKPETFHIIGHSLGAHISGYAGERVQHVGRITGLDPANPYFQNTDKVVRLDPTDALFVDILHTDGESILKLGYGMIQPCGHVDYYPNGGMNQPGCEKGPITQIKLEGLYGGVKQFVACNHLRAYDLFTESINSACPFTGYQCNSYDDFKAGTCSPCHGKCGHMGFHADRVKPAHGHSLVKYYLKTGPEAPFCRYHYEIKLTFAKPNGASSERGKLYINLIGQNGQTGDLQLGDDNIDIRPGHSMTFMVTSLHNLGTVLRVEFRWDHDAAWYNPLKWNPLGLRHPKVYVGKVEVVHGLDGASFSFCGDGGGTETDTRMLMASHC